MLDFLQKTKEKTESYWALVIEDQWISSAVWKISDGKVEVVSESPATRWDSASEDSDRLFIESVDTSLSYASQNLPEGVEEPTKTVFGVSSQWISDGNIKEEYLDKLKKVCDSLSLTPSGFVVLSEAISHFIKFEEESPLSGVVVGVSDQNLDISIFNLGKLVGTTNVARSITIEDDVVEGISRLNVNLPNVPSRIVLYNQKEQELEEIKGLLNDVDWAKLENSKFMHTPKVDILQPNKKILAVALAGGSELGEVSGVSEKHDETRIENLPEENVLNVEDTDSVTAEDLGFVVESANIPVAHQVEPQHIINPPKIRIRPSLKLPKMPHFSINLGKIKPNLSWDSRPIIMGGSLLVTLLVFGFVYWWFAPKATVTLYVTPKKIEDSISLKLGGDLKSETVEVEVSGDKTKPTTGTKTVGDKAKGQVKIQNGTAFPINVSVGTSLLSSSDLKFVTVKSASISGALSPSEPGIATIDVEASSIGSEYNLSKDEILKVGNYPKAEVDATIVSNFSGGSSRQISAVSEEDRKKVLKELKDELSGQAIKNFNEKIDSTKIVIDSSKVEEITEENYSNKVGDEATNIKLSLSLKVSAKVVLKSDLSQMSRKTLESKIPDGFVLRDDQMLYEFTSQKDGKDEFDVNVSANLLPTVNTQEIAKKIVGKYPNLAEDYLKNIAGYVKAEFRVKPLFPGKLGTLPHLVKNINIEVSSER